MRYFTRNCVQLPVVFGGMILAMLFFSQVIASCYRNLASISLNHAIVEGDKWETGAQRLIQSRYYLTKALEWESSNTQVYRRLAHIELLYGRYAEAERYLSLFFQEYPEDRLGHYYLGKAYEAMGMMETAAEQWGIAGGSAYLLRVATGLERKNEWTKAATLYTIAVRLDPGSAEAHSGLGWALYMSGGNHLEAQWELQEAIRLDPGLVQAYIRTGVILERRQAYQEARQWYASALQVVPSNTTAEMRIGITYLAEKQYWAALQHFEQVARKGSLNAYLHYLFGLAYTGKGNLDRAIQEIHSATELEPENALYRVKLADLYRDVGKIDQAVEEYQKVLLWDKQATYRAYAVQQLKQLTLGEIK